MTKRLAIIGRGTGGALSAAHFRRWTDWEIEWHYDPEIKTQAVGEGSTLTMARNLLHFFDFSHRDLERFNGTFKAGIEKEGWGSEGENFFHDFFPPNVAYHFDALGLQDFVMQRLANTVKICEGNVAHKDIDSDFILDCSGRPQNWEPYARSQYIPVNAVHVTQCYWDYPRFQHTLAIARPHGWVFGIPLRNRCSIGYLYNRNCSSLEQVKQDVNYVFEKWQLVPSDRTNSFGFENYYRQQNFAGRVAYNGNASFFLEPLEATSFGMMDLVNRNAWDLWNAAAPQAVCEEKYQARIAEIENMIMLHYLAGSPYKSEFWDYATSRAADCLQRAAKSPAFRDYCNTGMTVRSLSEAVASGISSEYGSWWIGSFFQNIRGLGIADQLKAAFQKEQQSC